MPKFIDYSDKRIGRVKVIDVAWRASDLSPNGKNKSGTGWNCICDCGVHFSCWSVRFKKGEMFECESCRNERRRGIDLTGRKFGRWNVIERVVDHNNKTAWKCQCDCGKIGIVSGSGLGKKGKSMSCGCLGRKMKSKHVNPSLYPPSHGLSKSKFYTIRTSLIHKCYNDTHPSYKIFGGKGIAVCDLWRNGAKDMCNWALENGWKERDIIVLKENEKEFNPSSCFILKEFDYRSFLGKSGGNHITYKGQSHSVAEWSRLLGVNVTSLRNKLKKYPKIDYVFSLEFKKQIFSNDAMLGKSVCDLYSQGKTQKEISEITGIKPQTLRYHLIKNKIDLRVEDKKNNKRPEISNTEIELLRREGLPINTIAKKLGCSFPCIKKRLVKMGII